MRILALDLATSTGWATLESSRPNTRYCGTWNLGVKARHGLRFQRLAQHIGPKQPEVICFENTIVRGANAAIFLAGLRGILLKWCEDNEIPPAVGVPIGTVKKHATGNGRASKDDMVAAAVARGWTPDSDDAADALWVLDYAVSAGLV